VVAKPALEKTDERESIRIMHAAIDLGVDFFDNAWEYHDGYAEEAMGRALAIDGKRKQVFLMTKNCERDYDGSLRNLEQSLRRFQTDYLDLWQFHELSYDNDPEGYSSAVRCGRLSKRSRPGRSGTSVSRDTRTRGFT